MSEKPTDLRNLDENGLYNLLGSLPVVFHVLFAVVVILIWSESLQTLKFLDLLFCQASMTTIMFEGTGSKAINDLPYTE